MAQKRDLRFITITAPSPVVAECTACGRQFVDKRKDEDQTGAAISRVKAIYEQHNCHEDASPSAARIVREATEE